MTHLARRPAGKLMEVMVKSVEKVKPARISSSSSSLSGELKKPYNLCLLDQVTSSFYTSFVFFYPAVAKLQPPAAVADQLKVSLSKTLVPFYPLAGRVRDNFIIDDFQAGVPFSEARVVGETLSEFLAPPKLDLLNDLVPLEPMCLLQTPHHDDRPQLAVQVNTFDCGGTAIGLNFHHKIADGGTIIPFLKTWSANEINSSDQQSAAAAMVRPDFDSASSVFPPQRSIPPQNLSFTDNLIFQNLRRTATRRFVFGVEAIASLRSRARSSELENPSRTETLSGFIWESAIRASRDDEQLESFGQMVNIRSRMGQRFSDNSIGNIFITPVALRSREGRGQRETVKELAELIRKATVGVDETYLNAMSGEEGSAALFQAQNWLAGRISGSNQILLSSSWLQFDLRGFELAGLGKPSWVGVFGGARGNQPCIENFMILNELAGPVAPARGMVEAWIRLDEDIMAGLETDPQFLEFASPNPPVIFN